MAAEERSTFHAPEGLFVPDARLKGYPTAPVRIIDAP
jgi:hypothetical protein